LPLHQSSVQDRIRVRHDASLVHGNCCETISEFIRNAPGSDAKPLGFTRCLDQSALQDTAASRAAGIRKRSGRRSILIDETIDQLANR
jgi:hypothetical protein